MAHVLDPHYSTVDGAGRSAISIFIPLFSDLLIYAFKVIDRILAILACYSVSYGDIQAPFTLLRTLVHTLLYLTRYPNLRIISAMNNGKTMMTMTMSMTMMGSETETGTETETKGRNE